MVKQDVLRTWNLVPGNKLSKIIGCYRAPGVHAVILYRFGQWVLRRNWLIRIWFEPWYLLLNLRMRARWGIEIHRTAQIDEGLYIGHYGGIMVSGSARIGRNLVIAQQTNIGMAGRGEKKGAPEIGDNVYIGAGAKVFGKIKIGDNVKIGPNVVVHKDIPDNAIVVLAPGFSIISYKGNNPVDGSQ